MSIKDLDSSIPNLAFLNIDQALGDLAQFIQHVKSDQFEGGRYRNASVSLVGCSYAGTMATWMRMAYPHLVNAAFSDSGPLQPQEEFPEYLEIVAKALAEQGSQECVDAIEAGVQGVLDLLATPTGSAQVSEIFQTCEPLNAASPLDVTLFFGSTVIYHYAALVQYATGTQIANHCRILLASAEPDPVRRLAAVIRRDECVETRYSVLIEQYRNTSYDSRLSTLRLWMHQTCVEYGWYQTTSGSNHPFKSIMPLEYYHHLCRDIFSSEIDETWKRSDIYATTTSVNSFNEEKLRAGIDRTKIFFGGWAHMPDRVVSVAGGHDPWSPLGPNESHAHHNAPVYLVPNTTHCKAILPTSVLDSSELIRVRRAVMDRMHEFASTRPDSPTTVPPTDPTTEAAPGSATSVAASTLILLLTTLALA
ncbi:hypothetical protein HW555_012923 [Spodoptera exigua]|uniref:Serine protease K12H4.7 n=1 Tax=Spodoptera exigua TaxID=7107 RepID=A0A835KXH5_SPOEX|nr:hypothetical protein HW555_012923 [Spodoptera exigua]